MKMYYGVKSQFFDDGSVNAVLITQESNKKPKNSYQNSSLCDIYIDWFRTRKEAIEWKNEAVSMC